MNNACTLMVIAFAVASAPGCATRFLPAPATPSRVAPAALDAPRPAREGEGQVTLDSTSGPARVDLITQRLQSDPSQSMLMFAPRTYSGLVTQSQYTLQPLCRTPCTVNLPLGTHELLFSRADASSSRTSTGFVTARTTPSYVRHTLGRQENSVGGVLGAILLGSVGAVTALAGGLLIGIGDGDTRDFTVPGAVTVGVGGVMCVAGVILGLASRPVMQPGATVQWDRDEPAR